MSDKTRPADTQRPAEERHEFKAEIQQLLHILVHSLYTDREIFMRELVSNATDALNRLQFEMLTNRDVLDPDAELAIHVTVDEDAKTLTVSDSGIGMTRQEIIENLGTIAQSGAAAFIKRLEEEGASRRDKEDEHPSLEMIGQFGVGFYSAFMVAEEIRVVSRSYRPDAEACEWVSDGSASFRVAPADKATRGTDVIVKLKEDAAEFASKWRLEQIVKKHSDFVAFPIYVADRPHPADKPPSDDGDGAGAAVNRQKPLWRQSPRELDKEEYDDFYKHLTLDFENPLLVSHLVTDVPVDIRSVLYVPGRRDRGLLNLRTEFGLKLYAKGVMIQEYNRDLLPNHFRFVEGVVESEDLPLNVSRETVQRNPAVRRIQKALVGKLIKELAGLDESEPDEYRRFWREFGIFIKEGIATDPLSKDDLVPLLRFYSSRTEDEDLGADAALRGEPRQPTQNVGPQWAREPSEAPAALVSLTEYKDRMADDQEAIYYLMGEDREAVARSPHLDYFRANDIEVLYMVDTIDAFMLMSLTEFDGTPLKNIDDASLELPHREPDKEPGETLPETDFTKLVARFVQVLGDNVTEVRESKILRDNPCRLVSPDSAPGREAQRVYRLLNLGGTADQEYEAPKKILEIHRGHPLIRNLARLVTETPDEPVIDLAIEQLYENQLLIEGLHPNPASMASRIQSLMEAAIVTEAATEAAAPQSEQEEE